MSKVNIRKMISHLESKWGSKPCPMCGKNELNIQDMSFQLLEFKGNRFALNDPCNSIPIIPVICAHCGYIMLVSGVVADVLQG